MASSKNPKFDSSKTREIYDVVQSFIGLISTDGILLDANKSALDFIDADLEDVIGMPFWDTPWWLGCEVSRTALKEAIRRGVSGEVSRFEAQLANREGRTIHADFSLSPIRNDAGEVIFLAPEARDITEIRKSRAALLETKARLGLAYDAADIGAWDLDLKTKDLYWNDQQFRLFDVPRGSEKLDFETAIARVHPDDVDRVVKTTLSAIRDNRPYRDEFRVVHRNGEVRWLVGHGRPLRHDSDGKPQAMTGINYDITERKAAELQLASVNEELEARVAERTHELEREMQERQRAREALAHSQRLEAVGQLAGGVAHDFNNLLTIIGGNLELIAAKLSDPRLAGMIEDAQSAVEAGANLNMRLLSFAQKRAHNAANISINEKVEFVRSFLARTLDENIVLITELDSDTYTAFVDPGEFDSALLNLVINARDAMPSGGEIRIVTGNKTFDCDDLKSDPSLKTGRYVRLSVSDTGIGMSRGILEQAMTPFFTTKEIGKGSGLGLSSVFGFAKQSGGFVTIESREGIGTTVSVYLPCADPPPIETVPAASKAQMPFGQREVVLAVEDDEAVLKLTRQRLQALGYSVLEAKGVAEAIETLESGSPASLVFSDIKMPGALTGYDLAAWIKEHRPHIRILLTSGYFEFSEVDDHSLDILGKPYSINDLASSLKDALR
ncbi:PAS domain S-box-containing protein [Roseovarius marisflavi]|uniref:histidine kinase n=1 Tax=Roseovarius marisflavi TaxID=1054996 RepID=A0A1M6XAD3_9RHOB|nr:PAS domain S-box protein [Roseovarius marisflavi]SHL02917.1 PAS domain S-box-containing protein [Roseovarius marisflavi]